MNSVVKTCYPSNTSYFIFAKHKSAEHSGKYIKTMKPKLGVKTKMKTAKSPQRLIISVWNIFIRSAAAVSSVEFQALYPANKAVNRVIIKSAGIQ